MDSAIKIVATQYANEQAKKSIDDLKQQFISFIKKRNWDTENYDNERIKKERTTNNENGP